MTRAEAFEIQRKRVNGMPVTKREIAVSEQVLNRNSSGKTPKYRLPALAHCVRERVNSILCFNLGRAIGRAE